MAKQSANTSNGTSIPVDALEPKARANKDTITIPKPLRPALDTPTIMDAISARKIGYSINVKFIYIKSFGYKA